MTKIVWTRYFIFQHLNLHLDKNIETIESTERHMFINVFHQFYRWGVKQEICVTLITLLCGLISQVHQSFPKTTLTSGQLCH